MILGRAVFALGAGVIVTAQEAILSHWFRGKGLGIAIGLQIAVSRATGWTAIVSVKPISDATGWYGNAFWVSSGICLFSWILNVVYVMLVKYGLNRAPVEEQRRRLRVSCRDILPIPPRPLASSLRDDAV